MLPPLREASGFPSKSRASSGLAGAPSCPAVGAQPMGKTPGGNISSFSAAGATLGMAATARLRKGEECHQHLKGLSPAFRKAQRQRITHHQGGRTSQGSAHLRFHPPAVAGNDASDHQHQERCGRDAAADEHLPMHSPNSSKTAPQRAKNTSCPFTRFPPHPGKKFGCSILPPSEVLPLATA